MESKQGVLAEGGMEEREQGMFIHGCGDAPQAVFTAEDEAEKKDVKTDG